MRSFTHADLEICTRGPRLPCNDSAVVSIDIPTYRVLAIHCLHRNRGENDIWISGMDEFQVVTRDFRRYLVDIRGWNMGRVVKYARRGVSFFLGGICSRFMVEDKVKGG